MFRVATHASCCVFCKLSGSFNRSLPYPPAAVQAAEVEQLQRQVRDLQQLLAFQVRQAALLPRSKALLVGLLAGMSCCHVAPPNPPTRPPTNLDGQPTCLPRCASFHRRRPWMQRTPSEMPTTCQPRSCKSGQRCACCPGCPAFGPRASTAGFNGWFARLFGAWCVVVGPASRGSSAPSSPCPHTHTHAAPA